MFIYGILDNDYFNNAVGISNNIGNDNLNSNSIGNLILMVIILVIVININGNIIMIGNAW